MKGDVAPFLFLRIGGTPPDCDLDHEQDHGRGGSGPEDGNNDAIGLGED